MKILLYEPDSGGHRDVILAYVLAAIKSAGLSYYLTRERVASGKSEIESLRQLAISNQCELIHILTADGRGRRWTRESLRLSPGANKKPPIVATYYLFSNLRKLIPGLVWDWLIFRLGIERILISADQSQFSQIPAWRRRHLSLICDPWDPATFPIVSRQRACEVLGLNPRKRRLLVFGDLSVRKGVDLVVEAFSKITETDVELVLAGVWHDSLNSGKLKLLVEPLRQGGRLVIHSGFVDELLVSSYFCSADYIICAYPAWFKVSSNTFTRACAAGKPVIGADHGAVGEAIKRYNCGFSFVTGSIEDLKNVISVAVQAIGLDNYKKMQCAGLKVAAERTTEFYCKQLIEAYYSACGKINE